MPVLVLLAADRFELLGLTRGSGWNVLLAAAVVCLGLFAALIWFVVSLLLRRRFQFGLKSVLVLTVIVATLCSWCAVRKQQASRQKAAVKAIQKLGGGVGDDQGIDVDKPAQKHIAAWCQKLVGPDFLLHAVSVSFYYTQVGDAGLVHLKELTSLKELDLNDTQTTDAGLMHLKELTNLEVLLLYGTQVTYEGVEKLQQSLPNCEIRH